MKRALMISTVCSLILGGLISTSFAQAPPPPDWIVPPTLQPREAIQHDDPHLDILILYTARLWNEVGNQQELFGYIHNAHRLLNQASPYPTRLVGIAEAVGYNEPDDPAHDTGVLLGQIQSGEEFQFVRDLRDAYGADNVAFLTLGGSPCGLAYQWGDIGADFSPYAYSVVSIPCLHHGLAHEFGHNSGAAHQVGAGNAGLFDYSHAYVSGTISTLMTSGTINNHVFSHPPEWGIEGESDNYATLEASLPVARNWRQSTYGRIVWLTTATVPTGTADITGTLLVPWSITEVSIDAGDTWSTVDVTGTVWTATITVPAEAILVHLLVRLNSGETTPFTLLVRDNAFNAFLPSISRGD